MSETNHLGASVRRMRTARRWSIKELAKRAEVSESTVARLERGSQDVSLSLVAAIALALGSRLRIDVPCFVPLSIGKDSKEWIRAGDAAVEADGRIRLTLPLSRPRTLLLRPVADASGAEAWPFRVTEREAWPKAEG
jgi:transcriptional regulator with XRE-family HTH domain